LRCAARCSLSNNQYITQMGVRYLAEGLRYSTALRIFTCGRLVWQKWGLKGR